MKGHRIAALAASALLCVTRVAGAITVDGQLDAGYGTAVVTQTNQTGLSNGQITGDNTDGNLNFADGSELDGCYATVSNGVLYLFLTGNVALELNANQNGTVGHVLDLFFDTVAGGQNTLNGLGTGNPLNGFTFDSDFAADYMLEFYGEGDRNFVDWRAEYGVLPTATVPTLSFLGTTVAGGPGTLSGGLNPYGILGTIDNHNTGGVTYGCDAASGAGVTTGVEWAIPLLAIGSPTGCFKLTVIVRQNGSSTSPVSNQVIAPVPVGTCPLGQASLVNLTNVPGDQFATICAAAVDVPGGAAAPPVLRLVGPNPVRADRLRFAFALPEPRPATLQMLDCAGRVVRERVVSPPPGGEGWIDLAGGRALSPGVYWLHLSQGARDLVRKITLVR